MRKIRPRNAKPAKENRYQIAGTNVKLLFAGCRAMLHSGRSIGWGRTNTAPTTYMQRSERPTSLWHALVHPSSMRGGGRRRELGWCGRAPGLGGGVASCGWLESKEPAPSTNAAAHCIFGYEAMVGKPRWRQARVSRGRLVALKLRIVETASEPYRIVFGGDTEMILPNTPLGQIKARASSNGF